MSFGTTNKDSFEKYDNLYNFLSQPISQVMGICNNEISILKEMLYKRVFSLKGEIRENIKAHEKQKDTDIYLKSAKSKIKDLYSNLLGREVYPNYEGSPLYPSSDRTQKEEEFIGEIKAAFNSLFEYIDDLQSNDPDRPVAPFVKEKKKRKTSPQKSYTLNHNVDIESFKKAYEQLKKDNLISQDTTEDQFLTCFSGSSVEVKVKWEKQNALSYFIDQLDRKHYIQHISNGKWVTASECFSNKYGKGLNSKNLGKDKIPEGKNNLKIDEAIKVIKMKPRE